MPSPLGLRRWRLGSALPPQIGGMRIAFDPTLPRGSRLVTVELPADGGSVSLADWPGKVLLVTNNYVVGGGDQ